MDPSRFRAAKELFDSIRLLPDGQRTDWLLEHCPDPFLRAEVLDLIGRIGEQGDALDDSVAEALGYHAAPTLANGTLLNERYRLTSLLANGGFATVYLANDERLADRRVVIKVLDRVRNPGETLIREIRALAKITDPGVVGIFDQGTLDSGSPFLVTQYIEGRTLRELLRLGVPPRDEGLRLIREVARALSAAHDRSIPHLDIKPENIIVGANGSVTIIDFGLSSIYASGPVVAGSAAYMAPEQSRGVGTLQSDVFSLGVLACEILTGSPRRDNARAALKDVPRRVVRAIESALSVSPELRPASASEFSAKVESRSPLPIPVWVGAAVVALLGMFFLLQRPPAKSNSLLDSIPATSLVGSEQEPSYSPDGSRLYFTNGFDLKTRDIYFVSSGQEPVRLTSHSGDERRAVCSMDGKQIAFIRSYSGGPQEIVVMPALGGPERVVALSPNPDSMAWSASGHELLISDEGDDSVAHAMRVFDLERKQWRHFIDTQAGSEGDIDPSLSPDGKWIAFVRRENASASDLYVQMVDEHLTPIGNPRRVTSSRGRKEGPQWTPDGRELVYSSGAMSFRTVWRVPINGGEERRIAELGSRVGLVSVPKHAWKLAYSVDNTDSNIWRARMAAPDGPVVENKVVVASSFHDEEVRLSPDEKRILFTSQRNGSDQVFTADADGNGVRQITSLEAVDSFLPSWIPGSSEVLLGVNAKPEGRTTKLLDLQTNRMRTLVSGMFAVSASSDGKRILLRSSKSGRDEIWSYDLGTGNLVQRTRMGSRFARESSDGRTLFFSHSDSTDSLWALGPDGKVTKVVEDMALPGLFAIRGYGIYYVRNNAPAICVKRFSDGKEIELLKLDKPPFWGLDVSSDGKTIYYSRYETNNVDVMVVNNFQ